MRIALFAATALILLLSCVPGMARDFHVSAQACADDGNDGSSAACGSAGKGPWKTLGHAMDNLSPGDILHVGEGRYFEADLAFGETGQPGKPVTVVAVKPGATIIDGSRAPEGTDGIYIEGGKSHIVLDGLTVENMPSNGIATDDRAKAPYRDITVRRCTLRGNRLSGLELAAVHGFVVEDVVSENNGYYGVSIIGSKDGGISSRDGVVRHTRCNGHVGPEGHGLAINQGSGIVVDKCEATHNRVHGFDVSDWPKGGALSSSIKFTGNRAWDNGKAGFAVNSDSSDVLYLRNVAWKNGARWAYPEFAPGFWCYEGCRNCSWINNTSVGNSLAGFQVDDKAGVHDRKPAGTMLSFVNNIAWDNGQAQWQEMYGIHVSRAQWQLELRNNNFGSSHGGRVAGIEMQGNSGKTFTGADIASGALPSGNISQEPGFVNAEAGDFRLAPNSGMKDKGAPVNGVRSCGKAPDIGAAESCP